MLYLKIRDMKKLILISLLVVAMGMIAFMGCERPETIDPTNGQPQRANDDSLINQQGDNTTSQSTKNLSGELIGTWIEISPCDSCRTYTFTKTDSIFLTAWYDNVVYKMSYMVVNEDSIQVTRLWDIELSKKTTTNNVVFLSSDTIRINQFLPVDIGITGFEDVVLNRIE